MMPKTKIYLLLFFSVILVNTSYPQVGKPIEKSIIIETIEGRDFYLHFVKKGETLFAIARAYELTVDDIFKSNPQSRNGIATGNILKIPTELKKQIETPNNNVKNDEDFFYHIVKKQETLFGISKKYGIGIDQILELNPEMGDYPKEGQTLKIPVKENSQPTSVEWKVNTVIHTVEKGETLYAIARTYNVTIGEIRNANPNLAEVISIGTTLIIPNQEFKEEEEEKIVELDSGDKLIEHKVIAGETLYSIAKNYAVSLDSLRKYNETLTANISIDQLIYIPPSSSEYEYIVHKADKKQTLAGISKMYDVDVSELKEINPGIRKKAKKGQFVKIPVEPREDIEVVNAVDEGIVEPEPDLDHCFDGYKHKQGTYNIALMLPLFLEELDSIDFEKEKDFTLLSNFISFRFLDFYSGFKMAADSMKNIGMNLNVFVYDVDNNPDKTDKVLNASELGSMDLIIGPLFAKSFRRIADFAKTWNIPIVNPLSERDEIIYGNSWVYKIQPSKDQQLDQLVSYITYEYPGSNVVVVRNNKYKYQSEVSFIRNYLNTRRPGHVYVQNQVLHDVISSKEDKDNLVTENKLIELEYLNRQPEDSLFFSNLVKEVLYVEDSTTGLKMNLSEARHNIVIALSDDIVQSKELLSQLNKLSLERDITLFGLPDWSDYSDLETSHLMNLEFHGFTSRAVNFSDDRIKSWIQNYRDLYNTEPSVSNYAFDGFDIGWYFLNALYNYGKNFGSCLQYLSVPLIQTNYQFESDHMNGYQNIYWNLGKYKDYQFIKVQSHRE